MDLYPGSVLISPDRKTSIFIVDVIGDSVMYLFKRAPLSMRCDFTTRETLSKMELIK